MKIESAFLRTRVARRIFFLFVVCALVPIGTLAAISYWQVSGQIRDEARRQLHRASKAAGMAIVERLTLVEAELEVYAASSVRRQPGDASATATGLRDGFRERIRALHVRSADGGEREIFRRPGSSPAAAVEVDRGRMSGRPLLTTAETTDFGPHVFLTVPLDTEASAGASLTAEIEPEYLWGTEYLPPLTELTILDEEGRLLFSTLPGIRSLSSEIRRTVETSWSSSFPMAVDGTDYLASQWSMPLQAAFSVRRWTVILARARSEVMAPMDRFRSFFPPVVLLALWLVLLLSSGQIRRSLVPLEKLQEGTRRIAGRDFESSVQIDSGDEFEELAHSFNRMARTLGRQFDTLSTIAEIDRAVLSALDIEVIVDTVLARAPEVFDCADVSVTLLGNASDGGGVTTVVRRGDGSRSVHRGLSPPSSELADTLVRARDGAVFDERQRAPDLLTPLWRPSSRAVVAAPVVVAAELVGVLGMGYDGVPSLSTDDRDRIRQVADQVAVALSNARLIANLEQANRGALLALARAIDASSSWTAGHSERVTALSIRIGTAMGLSEDELELLYRGGLVHDIGKIGVPADILDKPGKLTDEEYEVMKRHPRIGARILEPIPAFADVLPIVLQHHERVDGDGYPDGVEGEAIALGARICAVADVYDAVTSDRPYRKGMNRQEAVQIIVDGSGTAFDPRVVAAFLDVVADSETSGDAVGSGIPSPHGERSSPAQIPGEGPGLRLSG